MNDREILEYYMARDERAITCTAEKYGAALLHQASGFVCHEDAEECVNDTFLSAWNHIPPEYPQYFYAWLAKVCRNHCLGRIRWESAEKRCAELVELSDEMLQCIPDKAQDLELEAEEIGAMISRWLKTQKEEKRIMFMRRYWFGDSVQETADFVGCSQSRVKVTLHRMREQLKEELERQGVTV